MERLGNPAVDTSDRFTYRHYRTWPDEERWELIEGQAISMKFSYGTRHQDTVGSLLLYFNEAAKKNKAEMIQGPFDVLVQTGDEALEEIATILQPDISVFLDRSRVGELFGLGVPDLVAEVINPRTAKKDYCDKFEIYERRGTLEYWIIDPFCFSIYVFNRDPRGSFSITQTSDLIYGGGTLRSSVLKDLSIDPAELFADILKD